jgi:hypothetical protein
MLAEPRVRARRAALFPSLLTPLVPARAMADVLSLSLGARNAWE